MMLYTSLQHNINRKMHKNKYDLNHLFDSDTRTAIEISDLNRTDLNRPTLLLASYLQYSDTVVPLRWMTKGASGVYIIPVSY